MEPMKNITALKYHDGTINVIIKKEPLRKN